MTVKLDFLADALEKAGINLSPEAQAQIKGLVEHDVNAAKGSALAEFITKVLGDAPSFGYEMPEVEDGAPLKITSLKAEDGTVTYIVTVVGEKATNGKGAFGGGGGHKVHGPFKGPDGTEYKTWHEVAEKVLGHQCKEGTKAGTSECGYWSKELVALRDGGQYVPVNAG